MLAQADDLPRPAKLEVALGKLETTVGGCNRGEALAPLLVDAALEEQAVRLVLVSPDPAAKLMQLREPESLGALDEHDRRVGDVDADLDDARGDEHVGVAADEAVHPLGLLACRHAPVEQLDAQIGEDGGAEALVLGGRAARAELVRLLDERADDERLAALVHLASARTRTRSRARSGGTTRVSTGWRPGGISRSSLRSTSPYSVFDSERGIGVAVMAR